jgi:hypothetical protein
MGGSAGRDPDQQPFFAHEPSRHGDGVVVLDRLDLVDEIHTQDIGLETGPDALDRVRAVRSAGEDGRSGRLHRDRRDGLRAVKGDIDV